MKIYCQKCGHPSAYATYKPKFCSACGMPLDLTVKASVAEPLEEEADRPLECLPLLHKLDVFIDASDTQPKSVKFEDVLGSKGEGEEEYKRGLGPEIDPKTFRQQFRKEAGSLRAPDNDAKKTDS